MDAFCIYTSGGKALVEQIYIRDRGNKLKNDLLELARGKTLNEYYFVVHSDNNSYIKNENKTDKELVPSVPHEKNFVYAVRNNELLFLCFKRYENNPILILEIINQTIDILKTYFNVNKLNENVLINNYSVLNFLMHEILTKGKPSVFIDDILKKLIKNESSFLNETLKITPLPNSLYNMIANKNKNPVNATIPIDENNINFSFSNGTCVNSNESMFNYWRVSPNSTSSNELYIDIIENVNCVVGEQNKLLHYEIVGNITVNANINGFPTIKMYIKNLNLNECQFHFTVNYAAILKNKKKNRNENVIYFTPLNKEYTVAKYFYAHSFFSSIEKKMQNCQVHLCDQLTDVLNISKTTKGIDTPEKKKGNSGSVENTQQQKNEMDIFGTISLDNIEENVQQSEMDNYMLYDIQNINEMAHTPNFDPYISPKLNFLSDEDDDHLMLPLHVSSDIVFIEIDKMYKIKLYVKFNNICKEKNSNFLLTDYENIVLKMPIHSFINSVNLHCSVGSIGYNEKSHCIYWHIKIGADKNISTYAYISLYVKQEEENKYCNEYISLQDNSLKNLIYPSFKFVVYASLKVNGISVTKKKIEKVEIADSKNVDMYNGCRYTTLFQCIEFRL